MSTFHYMIFVINTNVNTFEQFFESIVDQEGGERAAAYRGSGIYTSERQWKHLMEFPDLFNNKFMIIQQHLDPRYKKQTELFTSKVFNLVASVMGYGTSQGFKLPKTQIILQRQKAGEQFDYGGQHGHYRKRSWSHTIEINLDAYIYTYNSLRNFVSVLAHELSHGLQTSMRRFHRHPDRPEEFRWDKEWYTPLEPGDEGYKEQPWEQHADQKADEAVDYAMQYLNSGVVRGFNPKRV